MGSQHDTGVIGQVKVECLSIDILGVCVLGEQGLNVFNWYPK